MVLLIMPLIKNWDERKIKNSKYYMYIKSDTISSFMIAICLYEEEEITYDFGSFRRHPAVSNFPLADHNRKMMSLKKFHQVFWCKRTSTASRSPARRTARQTRSDWKPLSQRTWAELVPLLFTTPSRLVVWISHRSACVCLHNCREIKRWRQIN